MQLDKPLAGEKASKQLDRAQDTIQKGVTFDPASLRLHGLLLDIYRLKKNAPEAAREDQIIQKLRSGSL